jgi:hypothetical protein
MDSPKALAVTSATPPGLPGSSTDLSSRAVPKHPGESDDCSYPCFVAGIRLHPKGEDWPLSVLPFHEAESVRFRYGSRVCLPRLRQRDCSLSTLVWLHVRWAIYMVSTSHLTRSARLSWRTPCPRGTIFREAAKAMTPTHLRRSPFSKGEFLTIAGCGRFCTDLRFLGTSVAAPNDGATRSDREDGSQSLQ